MTNNTNKKMHPIPKLINLIVTLIAVAGFTYATAEFLASSYCQTAFGIGVSEQSDWKVKACAKYYWDMDLENLGRW
ncbi:MULTISPECIES: hypothetical protein [Vibrio]|uniref:hypothetical protein n=2 Tax=Vibrionaceae TaxID=641 RepID=UPI001A8E3CA5|nr:MULTISPECIES: hypothetical protein [Vibrio]MBO0208339.1 hypothetical protein [Vibrio sp. Vb0877]MCF7456236.1 hypothetical protein [Vibrio sp. A1-1]MDA0420624.1 hypothetical protein [Vibrio alginolyticus]